ncbi:MAG: DNA translocase FtsK, partial [Oscillospiraceae bacterium]
MSVVLFTLGLLVTFLAFVKGNAGWLTLHRVLLGLFGAGAYFLGPVFCYIAVMSSLDRLTSDTNIRIGLTGVTILLISAANQIFAAGATSSTTFFSTVKELYSEGEVLSGGGIFGAIFSVPL